MNHKEAIRYWLDLAREDIRVARHLLKTRDSLHALFFGQLAIEKMLKALFVRAKGSQAPRIHHLVRLAMDSGLVLSQEDEAFLNELSRFNIESRYPTDRMKMRRVCTRTYTSKMLEEVARWQRRLKKEIER